MTTPKIPLKDFFRNPEKAAYKISPDGRHYSFLAPLDGRLNIFVQELGTTQARRVTNDTERDIVSYLWANDTRILYLQDKGGDENHQLFAVDIDGENFKPLTDFDGVKTTIIDDLEDEEDAVIVGLNKRNPRIFDPYRLNIKTGELMQLAENPGNIVAWMTDHRGKLRLAITFDGVNTSLLHRGSEENAFETVMTLGFKDQLRPLLFTFDNERIYAASNLSRDTAALVEIDLSSGKEVHEIYEHPEYDVSGLLCSRRRKCLTGATYTSWKVENHLFDDEIAKMFERISDAVPGYEFAIMDQDRSEQKFIVGAYSDRCRGTYYLYDKGTQRVEKIANTTPWLDEQDMAPMELIEFKSRDGLSMHGYLTVPVGAAKDSLPVVVFPHGGPWHRDTWRFDPNLQFLANRGYAVLQVNFRGSTGYGRKFWEASFKQWGLAMQDDISDGVRWLIEQGIADRHRIAIYGGSYGGYATLAGLAFTPDLYACGVDYVGVSNLFTFLETIPPYWEPLRDMLYEMVGHPDKDKQQLAATSPSLHADRIKVPLLIAQGANDPRVKKNESDQMVEAMRAKGVEVEYMVRDNEGHGFLNEENRFAFYEAVERFLSENIGSIREPAVVDGGFNSAEQHSVG
jgi:dipeptidyl aminopeptidase/acylaminoacyl peptidase